jgi:dihydroorotate dehydrogenase electron transfer subunit
MTAAAGAGAPEIEVGLAAPEPGPRVTAPFGRRLCAVRANEPVGPYRLLGVEDSEGPEPLPGQFYMLSAATGWGGGGGQRPFLGRAFSVCRVRGQQLDFLVEAVGPGTRRLAALGSGEGLWLVGPLGIGFTVPAAIAARGEGPRALLVGGGIGIAPLVVLAQKLSRAEIQSRVLLGFRSARYAEAASIFDGEPVLATDDGSAGHGGLVTELLESMLDDDDGDDDRVVFACGPPPMLEAVRTICVARSIEAQLAMEETMACGFGACFGCVVRSKTGYRRLCLDGPVVAATDLDESWLPT